MKPMTRRPFEDGGGAARRVVLPWGRTLAMCAANVRQRRGRAALTFVCIAAVVAFFSSSMLYQRMLGQWMRAGDAHALAVLEKAGVFANDAAAVAQQGEERTWLLALSGVLCLVGIANTILMSVTERIREIGTLKCLGAVDGFVVRLFLIENALIGALASLVGALLGGALGLLQLGAVFEFGLLRWSDCARALGVGLPLAVGLGTLLALLASIYPAYVASRMKPVDAMRVEI